MYIRGFCDFDEARELGNICVTAGNVIVAGSQCGSFCTFCSIAERSIFMEKTALLILAEAIIKFADTNPKFGGGGLAAAVMAVDGGEDQLSFHIVDRHRG